MIWTPVLLVPTPSPLCPHYIPLATPRLCFQFDFEDFQQMDYRWFYTKLFMNGTKSLKVKQPLSEQHKKPEKKRKKKKIDASPTNFGVIAPSRDTLVCEVSTVWFLDLYLILEHLTGMWASAEELWDTGRGTIAILKASLNSDSPFMDSLFCPGHCVSLPSHPMLWVTVLPLWCQRCDDEPCYQINCSLLFLHLI